MHNSRPVLALLAALATFASVSAEPPQRVVNIAMEDQFKSRHETGTMRGDVVVLVYAERAGSIRCISFRRASRRERELYDEYLKQRK